MKQMVKEGGVAGAGIEELHRLLSAVPGLDPRANEPLAPHTRFGIGGPADLLVTARDAAGFTRALTISRETGLPWVVIGAGTNLIVSDLGFRGAVLKLAAGGIRDAGSSGRVEVESGAVLQDLVDWSIARGLRGLDTMTGIPGWVGAAIYGNAGAYGHSIQEVIASVSFFDGSCVRAFDNAQCEFHYRESAFKRHKSWIILSSILELHNADTAELKRKADGILAIRNQKYPPTMKCAGSIFKNFLYAELPPNVQALVPEKVVREGKVPSAWFLEQAGAKGLRVGDIQVASYHANLIYNDGAGTARDLVTAIRRLKEMVERRFGIPLAEEVQYVGTFEEA
jgi:UDP-N-acetylmuramate dehydrogenase